MNIDIIINVARRVLESKPRMSCLYIEETLTDLHRALTEEEKRINESLKPVSKHDRIRKLEDWSDQDQRLL